MDYSETRNLLGVREDYAFYFKDQNDSLIGMGEQCVLGSNEISENKNLIKELLPAAYYHNDEDLMSGWMNQLNADTYSADVDSEVNNFFSNLNDYRFVLMENPKLKEGSLTTAQKKEKLNNYIKNGGILFLTQNVSINVTGVGFTNISDTTAEVVNDEDEYLELANGTSIEDDDTTDASFTVKNIDTNSYTELARYTTADEAFIARWKKGIGKGYYFGTVDATYKEGGSDINFEDKIGGGAENAVNVTKANCTSKGDIDSDNVAKTERLAIHDSEIVKMVVLSWT